MKIFQHVLPKKIIETIIYEDFPTLKIETYKNDKFMGQMICEIHKESKRIKICDIHSEKKNKGYGSLMMRKLIELARQSDCVFIDGWLSRTDYDHKERLLHFYRKFGFDIIPCNEIIKFADIKLNLKEL